MFSYAQKSSLRRGVCVFSFCAFMSSVWAEESMPNQAGASRAVPVETSSPEPAETPVPVQAEEPAVKFTQTTEWFEKPDADGFYLLMNKSKNELSVHSFKDSTLLKVYRAITGSVAGDKEREGDFKTPEGIYFVESPVPQAKLFKLHGPAAFELNYPNVVDHIFRRTGKGIWIHGVDNDERMKKRFDTRGCVAVANKDILDLREVLKPHQVPIVIFEKEQPDIHIGLDAPDTPLSQRVKDWARVWASKNVEDYLAFYSQDFFSRKMNFQRWKNYKMRLAKQYPSISVEISDLKILRHGKYSVAIFKQKYEGGPYKVTGHKRLYLVGDGLSAHILAEESFDDGA